VRIADTMNRRDLLLTLSGAASGLLIAGCETEPKPAATATLTNNQAVHDATQTLDAVAGDLEEDAEAFDSDNWRDVVGQIKEHIERLRGAVDDLRAALQHNS
jgi:outer membrane murein-binding lipoprotein Lpp